MIYLDAMQPGDSSVFRAQIVPRSYRAYPPQYSVPPPLLRPVLRPADENRDEPPIIPLQRPQNPYPAIQTLYLSTSSRHPACGSAPVENSMHSSRAAFSSLQTQQGLGAGVAVAVAGVDASRGVEEEEAVEEAGRGLGMRGTRRGGVRLLAGAGMLVGLWWWW